MKYIYNNIIDMPYIKNKYMTYLIADNQGLIHDRLRELLNNAGFKERTKEDILNTNKYVDFFWIEQHASIACSTIKEVPCTSLIEQYLTESNILQSKPKVLIEQSKQSLDSTIKEVQNTSLIEQSNESGDRFDKDLYLIKSTLKTLK